MSGVPAKVRKTVLARAAGRCEGCGAYVDTELHHRLFRSRGGLHEPWNILALHGFGNTSGCHGKAHSGDQGVRLGWAVHSWSDPLAVPVLMFDGWYLLQGDHKTLIRDDEAAELMALHGIRTEVAS